MPKYTIGCLNLKSTVSSISPSQFHSMNGGRRTTTHFTAFWSLRLSTKLYAGATASTTKKIHSHSKSLTTTTKSIIKCSGQRRSAIEAAFAFQKVFTFLSNSKPLVLIEDIERIYNRTVSHRYRIASVLVRCWCCSDCMCR